MKNRLASFASLLRSPLSLLFVVPALLAAAPSSADENRFVGLRKCAVCHGKELMGDQVAAWRSGVHASAVETLRSTESIEIAKRLGVTEPPHEAAACLRCHSTAQPIPLERTAYPVAMKDAVQCESCHGPGSRYRKKKVMSDPDDARQRGLWSPERDASVCIACHNEESPTFDPKRYALEDGSHVGFDFEQALVRIAHPIPAHVKGNYIALEREAKKRAKQERRGAP